MKIVASRDILTENINIVLKAVSTRTTLQILECILIVADEKGLRFIGNDLELGIETDNMVADVLEQGSVALEAKMFSDIIRRMPSGNVSIETDENHITLIKCQKSEFKILGQSGSEFPFLPEIEKTEVFRIQSNVLKGMIKQTIFSVAVDDSKPIMTGELMEINRESRMIKLVAIDGFRVSLREAELWVNKTENEDKNETNAIRFSGNVIKSVIPGKTLNEISKILPSDNDEMVGIYLTDKHILFELKSSVVVSRLIEGDFINYENIFTSDYTTMVYVNRSTLLESIERTSLISKDTKKIPVKLNIMQNKIIITSSTEMGNAYDEIDVEIDGIPLEIAFNPRYLIESLKAIEDDEICIQFTTPLSPCIIRNENDDEYKYLILPLRIKN